MIREDARQRVGVRQQFLRRQAERLQCGGEGGVGRREHRERPVIGNCLGQARRLNRGQQGIEARVRDIVLGRAR